MREPRRACLAWRRLRPGELDHEQLWSAAFALAVLVALATPSWLVARIFCPLKALTGLSCPTCGSTRAVLALMRLDFTQAFLLNPFVVATFSLWALVTLYGLVVVVGRLPRLRPSGRDVRRPLALAVGAALALNWAYLLLSGV